MDEKRLAELRAKLNNPEYINKACSEIGTRFTNVWEESGFKKPKTDLERVKSLLEIEAIRERNKNMYRDYVENKMSYQQLAIKYKIDVQLVRVTIRYWRKKNGRT